MARRTYRLCRVDSARVDVIDEHLNVTPLPIHNPNHSCEFEWGYDGSAPAELARQILWDYLDAEPHRACYQAFKRDRISRVGHWGDMIHGAELDAWLEAWRASHPDGHVTLAEEDGSFAVWLDRHGMNA